MKYLKQLREGERITEIYLCKHRSSAVTKNGKPYDTVILQDKTANLEGKIWEPSDAGIDDFEDLDYIQVTGEVTSFNGALQVNVKRARKCREGEYDPAEYLPVSKRDKNEMLEELNRFIASVKNEYLNNHRVTKLPTIIDLIYYNANSIDAEHIEEYKNRKGIRAIVVIDDAYCTCIFIGDTLDDALFNFDNERIPWRFEEPVMRLRAKAKLENDELVPIK